MKTKEILIDLIEYLNKYEIENHNSKNNLNMSDFIGYLNSQYDSESIKTKALSGNYKDYNYNEQKGSATDISILIVLMFRYAKIYIKKALKDSQIKSADEFSYLMTLMTYESLTKSELIQKQIMEKTSGTEIINRLVKLQLVEQYNDTIDKRSIRIKMTLLGRIEIVKILPQMRVVSQIVTGNLTEKEKTTLAYLLRKLELFHNDIFLNNKEIDINKILPDYRL